MFNCSKFWIKQRKMHDGWVSCHISETFSEAKMLSYFSFFTDIITKLSKKNLQNFVVTAYFRTIVSQVPMKFLSRSLKSAIKNLFYYWITVTQLSDVILNGSSYHLLFYYLISIWTAKWKNASNHQKNVYLLIDRFLIA